MKVLALVCRILLGLLFVVFGLNGFLNVLHAPPPPAGTPMGDFMQLMTSSGWLHIVSAFELVGGILVLIGGTAPIGLVLLGPVIFNALLFHILLAGGKGIPPAIVTALLEIVLIYTYRPYFRPIFTYHARPE